MEKKVPLLTVKIAGGSVGPGRIPVQHLLRLIANMEKALFRTGMVLSGTADSLRKGPREKRIKEAVALDLVLLTHGSPSVVLGFERDGHHDGDLFGNDFGTQVFESALDCLQLIQEGGDSHPEGCDPGVLMAWRDVGDVFKRDISHIEFSLNRVEAKKVVSFTPHGVENIQRRLSHPMKNRRTIEGRLLMVDFKEHGTRCRIHPSASEPVLCLFDQECRDEVLGNILQYVRIVGEAKEDPLTGKISSIQIQDIQRLEEETDVGMDLLPQGSPVPEDFWNSPSLDELTTRQAVRPVGDIRKILGTWPGDPNDRFEEEVHHIRQTGMIGGQT
ncbi:MAG: hypothetical protein JJU11_11640 [Candidatus Sumerlaeia bacterium]|nr:hypothetical protein [Candidatus Sumerlaeia bacterium]